MVTGVFTIPTRRLDLSDRTVLLSDSATSNPSKSGRSLASDPEVPPYVVGPENPLIDVVAQQLITRWSNPDIPSQLSHLVVIHGPTGIGKTHLLNALASTSQSSHSCHAIGHWNAVDWAREHAQAVRNEEMDAFQKQLDSLQMLILDDLDQLIKYQSAQRTLCSWLDRCQWQNKSVLIGCTQHPNSVRSWIAGLASRLLVGLLVRVAAPEPTTREAIILSMAKRRRFPITAAAVRLISQRVPGTPRDLQTAVLRCQASVAQQQQDDVSRSSAPTVCASTDSKPFDEQQVSHVLASFEGVDEPISLRMITRTVARYFDLTQQQLKGRSRRRGVAHARGIAIYVCRELTQVSFNKIGRHFDGRDHSTIVHAYEKIKTTIKEDAQMQQIHQEISNRLGQPNT